MAVRAAADSAAARRSSSRSDGRTLYFRSGRGLFAAAINPSAGAGGARGGARAARRRDAGAGRRQRRRSTRHLHRQPRNRSQGAARPGLQRGLAHHEAPLLRREDARRRLERGQDDLRAPPRLPRGRGRAARRDDDDDRAAERIAHRRQRRRGRRRAHGADALPGLRPRRRRVRASTRWATSTRMARPIATT